jgi:hypothetical protein
MGEQWRSVEGFPGYLVSDAGRVIGRRGRPLRLGTHEKGYRQACMMRDGRLFCRRVHRLVLTAFVGPPSSPAMVGAHLNGAPGDNRLSNLAWVSQSENLSHRKVHGTEIVGERNGRSVLTSQDVACIRRRLAAGDTGRSIAEAYGVHSGTVSKIKQGKIWRHVA